MEREVRYIQLPPIPEDIEMPALEAIWLIARMDREQQKDALAQLEAMISDEEKHEKPDYEKVQEILDKYGDVEDESIFSQYIECFRNLLAELILESYDVAAFVYQKRCVEGLTIVFCKHFLEKNAKYFWRMLHLQIGESCKALTGSCFASHKPLQIIFSCYSTRYGNGSSEFSSSCACSLK